MHIFKSLEHIPNYEELTNALLSYTEQDSERLKNELKQRFNAKNMKVIEDRILMNFIDNMASLFSGDFIRTVQIDPKLELLLTDAEQWAERYFHLFKKSAIFLDIANKDMTKRVEALDPTQYFKITETGNFLVSDGGSTWFFEDNGNNVLVYKKSMEFIEAVTTFDTSITIKENGFKQKGSLPVMPIVEWTYKKVSTANVSSIYSLEQEQIYSMSYAIDAGNTKQTHHPVLYTDEDKKDIPATVEHFGESRSMTVAKAGDQLKPYDPGSLQSLLDIINAYEKLSIRKAISYGVPKDSVVPSSKIESGEALKVALGYVNNKRKKFMTSAKIFELQIIMAMQELGFEVKDYKGIQFKSVEVVKDRAILFKNVNNEHQQGYISFREAIAELRGLTLEEADVIIKKEKLIENGKLFLEEN